MHWSVGALVWIKIGFGLIEECETHKYFPSLVVTDLHLHQLYILHVGCLIGIVLLVLHIGMSQMVQISTNVSVDVGEDITLTCEARGYPPPFITWLRNFRPLYHDGRYALTSYYGYGVLRISKARLSDEGMYACVIVSRLYGSATVQPAISVTVRDGKC